MRASIQILPFIYGTLVTSIIALIVAVPMSVGVALFLTEYSPKRLRTPIEYAVDLLAAVPSVIYGLWGVFVVLPYFLRPIEDFLSKILGLHPHLQRTVDRSFVFCGGHHPFHHDHAHHHLDIPGGVQDRPRRRSSCRLRPRGHAMGDGARRPFFRGAAAASSGRPCWDSGGRWERPSSSLC